MPDGADIPLLFLDVDGPLIPFGPRPPDCPPRPSNIAGRAFVWVDDEITDADRAWVTAHHPGSALLHRVNPACGLTAHDFSAIKDWLGNR